MPSDGGSGAVAPYETGTQAERAPMGRMRFWSAVVACVVGTAILVNLGLWQVDRLGWKQEIVATIEERIHADPRPIAEIDALAQAGGDVDYRPVSVTGRFLHDGERYFLSTSEGRAGWNVYTPMAIAQTQDIVFVNRGFVPYERKDPATRPQGQVEGDVSVTGLARTAQSEKPGSFLPDNDPGANAFFWRNIDDMAQGLSLPAGERLLPFFVDAGVQPVPGGLPVGGATVVQISNNHLQYAITWFSLAALMLGMLAILVVTQWRRRRSA